MRKRFAAATTALVVSVIGVRSAEYEYALPLLVVLAAILAAVAQQTLP